MTSIKKGESSINIVFDGKDSYTNHLFAKNVQDQSGVLEIDYSRYSERERKNLEGSDFQRLQKLRGNISHLIISDETVKKYLTENPVSKVKLIIDDEPDTVRDAGRFEDDCGFLRLVP